MKLKKDRDKKNKFSKKDIDQKKKFSKKSKELDNKYYDKKFIIFLLLFQ